MEDIIGTHPVPAAEIASDATAEPGQVEATAPDPDSGGGGDGRATTSSPCPLTQEQQVCNMKENWIRAVERIRLNPYHYPENVESNWFASVVSQLRDDPPDLEVRDFEMDASLVYGVYSGLRMTSLDAAILMGDLQMVRKILAKKPIARVLSGRPLTPEARKKVRFFWFLEELVVRSRSDVLYAFTPLHLAVAVGNIHIVDELLEKDANVNARNAFYATPLDIACKTKNEDILLKLLEKDEEGKGPLHGAVRQGDVDFMKKLSFLNGRDLDQQGRTLLHHLAASPNKEFINMTNVLEYLVKDRAIDMKATDRYGTSAFYTAIVVCNTKLVIALLDSYKEKIRVNEICHEGLGPPIQIAFEGGEDFVDIYRALMECDPVKSYMERLYRDRQVYVDSANAILVGAALIASVTFASWLQPPLNYTSYSGEGYSSSTPTPPPSDLNYVDVEHNIALRAFWIFNALSFYFAIASVVCGARSVLPRNHLFIKKTVERLRINLLVTSTLLACSVLFVIAAFAIAGTIVLTPLLKYQWYMVVPTLVGGMVCIISLVYLVKNMIDIRSNISSIGEFRSERLIFFRDRLYLLMIYDKVNFHAHKTV